MKRTIGILLLCLGMAYPEAESLAGRKTVPVIGKAVFSLERNVSDFTELPKVTLWNKGAATEKFELLSTLTNTEGKVILSAGTTLSAPAGGRASAVPFPGKASRIRGQVVLFRTEIKGSAGSTHLSGIFGEAAPVRRESVNVFGMNVHTS